MSVYLGRSSGGKIAEALGFYTGKSKRLMLSRQIHRDARDSCESRVPEVLWSSSRGAEVGQATAARKCYGMKGTGPRHVARPCWGIWKLMSHPSLARVSVLNPVDMRIPGIAVTIDDVIVAISIDIAAQNVMPSPCVLVHWPRGIWLRRQVTGILEPDAIGDDVVPTVVVHIHCAGAQRLF